MPAPVAIAAREAARAETAPADAFAPWTGACDPWNVLGVASDGLGLWVAGCRAWSEYVADLSRAIGPAALLDAQARWLAEGFDLCSQATADRLRDAGVTAPLLNDA